MTLRPKPETQGHRANAKRDDSELEKKAIKARLLLKLIKEGSIPRPPESFLKELQSLAASPKTQESSDLKERVRNLALHLQSLGAPKTTAKSQEKGPDYQMPALRQQRPVQPQAQRTRAQVSPLALADQHPAVIKRHLDNLDDEARANQLRALPGETARQVSLLTWQRGKK